jgi:hypothetical protein
VKDARKLGSRQNSGVKKPAVSTLWRGQKTPPDEPTLLDASGVDQKTRAKKTYRFYNYLNSNPFTLIRRCIV